MSRHLALLLAVGGLHCAGNAGSDFYGQSAEVARLHERTARACTGISEVEREACPVPRGQVVAVEAIHERPFPKGREFLSGATVYVAASPGMTAEWLGRLVECHEARQAELGTPTPAACPVMANSKVRVSGTSTGFAMAVTSDEFDTARAILATSQALVSR